MNFWELYENDSAWMVWLNSDQNSTHYRSLIVDQDLQSGDLYTTLAHKQIEFPLIPFRYPIPEILSIMMLARERGILLHATAAKYPGQGIIFAGHSGAGKSTTARIWRDQPGVTLLSDDRVILRKNEAVYWIHGTPWHGDANIISPEATPLTKIMILEHGGENSATRLNPLQATTAILTRCFPPVWDTAGMQFTLDFIAEMVEQIPVYQFRFTPDESMIDFVKTLNA